jgi:NADH dehydrogenase
MKLIVTGATGYIGEHVVDCLYKHGHTIISFTRKKPKNSDILWVPYDLVQSSITESELFTDVVAIIHLAATTKFGQGLEKYPDYRAAKHLLEISIKLKAKFIFISSQTARADAPTDYGQIKWLIEKEVLASNGLVIRPGQVYGGAPKGLFGTMVRLVEKLPVLPALTPAPNIQPIHVDDLAEAIVEVAVGQYDGPVIMCIGSTTISFTRFLSFIAIERLRSRRLFFPVPTALIKLIIKYPAIFFGEHNFIRKLHSLLDLPEMKTKNDIERIGIQLRSIQSGMHPSGNNRRRRLLIEGRTFFSYILKRHPEKWVLRRYARAVESLSSGTSMNLPVISHIYPSFLAVLDNNGSHLNALCGDFNLRLDIATRLAEATPQGAHSFLGHGADSGIFLSLATFLKVFVREIFLRLFGLCFRKIIYNAIAKAQVT